jgi:hypothetical protein
MFTYMPKLNAAGDTWVPNDWENIAFAAPGRISVESDVVANAAAVAALPAVAGRLNDLTELRVFVGGATAASIQLITVTGLLGGTRTYPVAAPAGVTLGGYVVLEFNPPLPASAVNTAISASMAALGAGNTNAKARISGYLV